MESSQTTRKRRTTATVTPSKRTRASDDKHHKNLLQKITVKDFMCHAKLDMEFGERVNFIVGQNGAGKSAILNALQAVFGAGARATSRKKACEWIRTGKTGQMCSSADVEIMLNNEYQRQPFDQENYGAVLHIKRHITKTASSYFLKQLNGKWEKINLEKIKQISRHFGIQSANPVHIMTQESTKEFLNAKTQKHKYNLFMEGTTLKQTKDNYDESGSYLDDMTMKNETKMAEMIKTKELLKGLAKKVEFYEMALEQGHTIEMRKKKLKWIPVVKAEKELQHASKEKDKFADKFKSHKDEEKKFENEIKEAMEEKANGEDQLAELKVKIEQCAKLAKPTKEKEARLSRQRADLKEQINEVERDINEKKREINELQQIREKNANPHMRAKLEETRLQICNIEEQLVEARGTDSLREAEREAVNEHLGAKKRERYALQEKEKQLGFSIDKTSAEIRKVREQEQKKTNPFGREVAAIRDEIKRLNQKGKWKGAMPIGPIGDYMIAKPEYSDYIGPAERIISGQLTKYVCFNAYDEPELKAVLGRHLRDARNIETTVMRWSDADIADNERFKRNLVNHRKYPTIYSMFNFKQQFVKRFMVEFAFIHATTIIPDSEEAKVIVQDRQELNLAYSFNMDRYEKNRAQIKSEKKPESQYFTQDRSLYIRQQEQALKDKMAERADLDKEVIKLTEACSKLAKQLKSLERNSSRVTERKLNDQKLELEQWIAENEITDNENDEYYRTEISERETKVRRCQNQVANLQRQVESAKKELTLMKAELAEQKKKEEELKNRLHEAARNAEEFTEKQGDRTRRKKHHADAAKGYKQSMNGASDKCTATRRQIDRLVRDAEASCARPDKIPDDEDREQRTIARLEAERTGRQEVLLQGPANQDQYAHLQDSVSTMKRDCKMRTKIIDKMRKKLFQRLECFDELKVATAHSVEENFVHLSGMNGYLGEMKINHEVETINIRVIRRKGNDNEAAQTEMDDIRRKHDDNCANLSGGERSITTVCFLMSVWEQIQTPLRCMDEFDVFMDTHHKQLATQILCYQAQETPDTQYLFLTPTGITDSIRKLEKAYGKIFQLKQLAPPRETQ